VPISKFISLSEHKIRAYNPTDILFFFLTIITPMNSRKFLLNLARRHLRLLCLSVVLGFSGGLFNGVSTALMIPVLLGFLGQKIEANGMPAFARYLLAPLQDASGNYNLLALAGMVLLLILLKNAATYATALSSSALKRALVDDLKRQGLRMLLEVDLAFLSRTGVGDMTNRLNQESGRTAAALIALIQVATTIATTLFFVGLLIALSWQLTLVTTVLLGLVTLVNQRTIARSRVYGKKISAASKSYSIKALEILLGMRLVRSSAREEAEYQDIQYLIEDISKVDFQAQCNSASIQPISEISGLAALTLIVILGRTFLSSQVEAFSAVLLTYLFLLSRTLPFVSQLNSGRNSLAGLLPSVDITQDFLRRDNKPFMKNGALPYPGLRREIHFDRISFTYPGTTKRILKDVDLHLPRNTTLALVGASGAGKSTVADLLPRFYDPTSGSIAIDGVDLREFDFRTLRRSMGIVSQDTFLLNASVRNNIAYGHPDATDDEVLQAAEQANAWEFIQQLPEGMSTVVGDRGVLLSGGQRQRLAIARALLQNPEILILDEATSALDTVSERLVQEAIDRLSNNRTTLVIAHRLSTVQKADQIAVMEQGKVVELGSHQELLAKNGYYANLCKMQLLDVSDEQQYVNT
jgi:ATP-binding cassette, subfamily B, bacterial MsbA